MGLYFKKQKRFLRKLLVGASLFLLGATAFFLLSFVLKLFFPQNFSLHPLISVLMMTVLSLAVYKPLDIAVTQFFKNYLFKKRSYSHMALMDLAEELSLVLDLPELSNLIVNTFGEVLQLKTVALLVPSTIREDFEIASAYGWNVSDSKKVRFAPDAPLIQYIRASGPHVLMRDRASKSLDWPEANRLTEDFDALRSSWLIPLFVKEEFMGAIAFSMKSPDRVLDEADFQFFREFARAVAKSVRNALCVNELKLANEKLQDVQSQLLQSTKLVAIEQLATGLAHEIHNPLTIISGKAQVLLLQKDRSRYDERVEEVLKTIVKQTKRAADITRKLLMFSQSSGSPKENLRLEQVLEDTMELVSFQTSLEGIEITRSFSGMLPTFYANVHEIREVFFNLILNAVQSVGAKGKIHCEMNYLAADQIIEISVADSGRGIEAQNLDKLFNPFFTTRHESVGLGLFVTKQIVHRYGGSIRVESRLGEGSLFLVQLPILESSQPLAAEEKYSLSLFPTG